MPQQGPHSRLPHPATQRYLLFSFHFLTPIPPASAQYISWLFFFFLLTTSLDPPLHLSPLVLSYITIIPELFNAYICVQDHSAFLLVFNLPCPFAWTFVLPFSSSWSRPLPLLPFSVRAAVTFPALRQSCNRLLFDMFLVLFSRGLTPSSFLKPRGMFRKWY